MNNANESVDVLSPLIVNPGTNDHYGAPSTIGTPSRIGTPWFRQVSSEFSERWSHHVGSIGYLGSLSIAVNCLTGPAMLNLPSTFQRAGFVPTVVTLLFVAVLSSLCCLHLSNTISTVVGNSNFRKEIEYSECFEKFWGHKSFIGTQILFFLCITCLNISSIVDTAQVVDTFFGHWCHGGSAALHFFWEEGPDVKFVRWDYSSCSEENLREGDCVPFDDDDGYFLTVGYVITLWIFVPMALMDLKENAAWQILGFVVLLVSSVAFVLLFIVGGLHFEYVSMWGTSWDTLFGVILFNYALVIAIPAWLYEKNSNVDVRTIVNGSSILSTVLYILIGALGAMTMPHVSQNMLESMMSGTFGIPMQVCASVFAFFIIGLGCPLFSVLTRMNLTGRRMVSRNTADLLAVYLPFSVSWLFYAGDWVTQLLSWGGMIFITLVAFILPLLLSLYTLEEAHEKGSVAIYGRWNLTSKKSQTIALRVLLALSVLSTFAALFGNFYL